MIEENVRLSTYEAESSAYTAPQAGREPVAASNSRWPRRLAVALVVLVWPLIWVGGLVTTYDAGMSVPDWPGTYGYNLFLYPISTWLLGPFDLFIEHGHRLLGALVGFVAIGFLIAAWWGDRRRWLTVLAGIVLFAVIGQGVLGGLRVTMSDRVLAMVHGCTGPVFFALCVVAACVTGNRWRDQSVRQAAEVGQSESGAAPTPRLFWPLGLVLLTYLQILFGAQLRHALPTASPGMFAHTAMTHAAIAVLLWLLAGACWWRMRGSCDWTLSRPAAGLLSLVSLQLLLGVGSWLIKYGYPPILDFLPGSGSYRLQSRNLLDAWIVTGHVATGSLILAVSTLLTVRLWRRRAVIAAMES